MILIGLGSSLSFHRLSPEHIITRALAAIDAFCGVKARSRLYASPAWPDPTDPPFINAAASLETAHGPEALLAGLAAIEAGFGRRRGPRNGPRTLDLDILDYKGLISPGGPPTLPHPRLEDRDFVLAPLLEVAPDWRHPVSGEAASALLAALPERRAWPL